MVILVVVLVLAYVAFVAAVVARLRLAGHEDLRDLAETQRNRLASLDRARANRRKPLHFRSEDEP
jgi:hypothetical protein